MPFSLPETKPWIMDKVSEINPKTVLDVGAGNGTYLNLIREGLGASVDVTAVEIWEPYIKEYKLNDLYNTVLQEDVREVDNFSYDLVIFGDILEHMSEDDALAVWAKVQAQAKYAIIAIPTVHFPQGAYMGNPYEAHVKDDWTPTAVLEAFSGIVDHQVFQYTGAFLAKF